MALIWLCTLTCILLEAMGLTGLCSGVSILLVLPQSILQLTTETLSETHRCPAEWMLKTGNTAVLLLARPLAYASRAVVVNPAAVGTTVDYLAGCLALHCVGLRSDTAVHPWHSLASTCCQTLPASLCSPDRFLSVPACLADVCRRLCSGSLHCCMELEAVSALVENRGARCHQAVPFCKPQVASPPSAASDCSLPHHNLIDGASGCHCGNAGCE